MRDFLKRRWFLCLLLMGLFLTWLAPGSVSSLVGWIPLQAGVALALFLMAWSLESRRLWGALKRPGPALWAVAVSYGILPLLALGLGHALPDTDLRIGLLICASVPSTLASSVIWTRLGGGNEATALLIVVLSNGSGWLATAGLLTLLTGTGAAPPFLELMRSLLLVLVVPVALGQLSRAIPPVARAVTRYRILSSVVARLLIFAIILKAAVRLVEHLEDVTASLIVLTAGVCIVVHLGALFIGFWGCRGIGWSREDSIAVAFGSSQKTLPVSLYIYQAYFQLAYPLAVLPVVFYHVLQLIVDTFVADQLLRPAVELEQGPRMVEQEGTA